jgi:hypothetical protein
MTALNLVLQIKIKNDIEQGLPSVFASSFPSTIIEASTVLYKNVT